MQETFVEVNHFLTCVSSDEKCAAEVLESLAIFLRKQSLMIGFQCLWVGLSSLV